MRACKKATAKAFPFRLDSLETVGSAGVLDEAPGAKEAVASTRIPIARTIRILHLAGGVWFNPALCPRSPRERPPPGYLPAQALRSSATQFPCMTAAASSGR